MSKKYPCVEMTLEVQRNEHDWRVWTNVESIDHTDPSHPKSKELIELGNKIVEMIDKGGATAHELQVKIASIPEVNAVQYRRIRSRKKHSESITGIVIYTKKFDDDPHG